MRRNGCPLNLRCGIRCLNWFHWAVDQLFIIWSMALLDDKIIECAEVIQRVSYVWINRKNPSLLRGRLRQNAITILVAIRRKHFWRSWCWSHTRIHNNICAREILLLLRIDRGKSELISRVLPVVIRRVNTFAIHPLLRLLDLHLGDFQLWLWIRLCKL